MRRDAFLRLLLWLLVIDLMVTATSGFAWWVHRYELTNPIPNTVAMALRMATWIFALYRMMGPVRELQRQAGERPDDALILAADHSPQWTHPWTPRPWTPRPWTAGRSRAARARAKQHVVGPHGRA